MAPVDQLTGLLGIHHPILLAPMAGATDARLVAAVSDAGALGGYGGASTNPDDLRSVVADVRNQTHRPFQVNLFAPSSELEGDVPQPGPRLRRTLEAQHEARALGPLPEPRALFGPAEQQLDVLLELGVPVISFHFGMERPHVERVHQAGALALCSATTVEEARVLEQNGVDVIVAQGAEAGGHRGTFNGPWQQALVGTLALVPAIVDAVSIPVVAAGGIMDGRGLVAARALGAAGVQIGTAFLGCAEAPVHDAWRGALDDAAASDTVVTASLSGRPARGLRNRLVDVLEAVNEAGEDLLPYPVQYSMSVELRKDATRRGDVQQMAAWSGQGVGQFRRSVTARELIEVLVAEAEQVRRRL